MKNLERADGRQSVRTVLKLIPLSMLLAGACYGQNAQLQGAQLPVLVRDALAAELRAAQDNTHPMRYELRKSSPRLTTTKEIVETRDGGVAMLLTVNEQPPGDSDLRKDRSRLDDLLANPSKQRHRKHQEDSDRARAFKVLQVLPSAFLYRDTGLIAAGSGHAERFVFVPNPAFNAPDMETAILTAMNGEIWIDPGKVRVVRLQAQLQRDVDFGWGVLGRLYKGGWITIDQAQVADGVWRIVKFQMSMSARVLFRTKDFQTTEYESHFEPVPPGLDYKQGIAMLRAMGTGALVQGR
jgi:hypothetical protein